MTAMVPVTTDVGNKLVRHCRWSPPGTNRVLRQQSRQTAPLAPPGVRHSFLLASDFHPVPGSSFAIPPAAGPGGCRLFWVSGNAPNPLTLRRKTDIGQGQIVTLTQPKSGSPIRDTLHGSSPRTPSDAMPDFARSRKPTRYHTVPCRPLRHPNPATLCAQSRKTVYRSSATSELRGCHVY